MEQATEQEWQSLDPAWIACDRRAKTYENLIILGLGVVFQLVAPMLMPSLETYQTWIWWGLAAFAVISLLHTWLWPPIEWRHRQWRFAALGLQIRRGVCWRHVMDVPCSRVQHTDVSQGPLLRKFGLARLTIFTAGTRHSQVRLTGVRHETALEIRDRLIEVGTDPDRTSRPETSEGDAAVDGLKSPLDLSDAAEDWLWRADENA